MRRVLGLLAAIGLGIGLVGVCAPVAVAKGPSSATIEGGGRVVSVGWETTRGRGTMDDLLDVTSFWQVTDARTTVEPARKGPAFVVRYVLGRSASGTVQEFRQVLYPASSAGSLVYTPGGQQRFGAVVPAHWGEAPVNLSLFLRSYGIMVPVPAPEQPVPVAASTPAPEAGIAAENDDWRGWWPAAGLLAMVVLGATGARLFIRRRA